MMLLGMMMIMVITTTTIMMKMIMKNKIEENSVHYSGGKLVKEGKGVTTKCSNFILRKRA